MMFSKPLNRSEIHKILVVSLTNIGDVILTFPVIDVLKREFPSAEISIIIGPKSKSLFKFHPHLKEIQIFDKHQPLSKSVPWIFRLLLERYDLLVDLRNTAIPVFIAPRYRTPLSKTNDKNIHMREKHLKRLQAVVPFSQPAQESCALAVSDQDKNYVDEFIKNEMGDHKRIVVMAAGAAAENKRWRADGFAQVADQLIQDHQVQVVFVGDEQDRQITQNIMGLMSHDAMNACGRMDLSQLAAFLQKSSFVLSNDSAVMHLASYLNVPILALFGPTDPSKYGPWGEHSMFLYGDDITVDQVMRSIQTDYFAGTPS